MKRKLTRRRISKNRTYKKRNHIKRTYKKRYKKRTYKKRYKKRTYKNRSFLQGGSPPNPPCHDRDKGNCNDDDCRWEQYRQEIDEDTRVWKDRELDPEECSCIERSKLSPTSTWKLAGIQGPNAGTPALHNKSREAEGAASAAPGRSPGARQRPHLEIGSRFGSVTSSGLRDEPVPPPTAYTLLRTEFKPPRSGAIFPSGMPKLNPKTGEREGDGVFLARQIEEFGEEKKFRNEQMKLTIDMDYLIAKQPKLKEYILKEMENIDSEKDAQLEMQINSLSIIQAALLKVEKEKKVKSGMSETKLYLWENKWKEDHLEEEIKKLKNKHKFSVIDEKKARIRELLHRPITA